MPTLSEKLKKINQTPSPEWAIFEKEKQENAEKEYGKVKAIVEEVVECERPSFIGEKGDAGEQGERGERGEKPTNEEIVEIIKPLIPNPIKGERGVDGRSPIFFGKQPPQDPKIGDLWYQD